MTLRRLLPSGCNTRDLGREYARGVRFAAGDGFGYHRSEILKSDERCHLSALR